MTLSVRWTDEARETFDIIVELIDTKWGFASAQKFVRSAQSTIDNISNQPYIFKASISKNIRKAYITKQTSMFYEVRNTEIILLYFWDNRQEPLL